jgi:hypothetical protein
MNGPPIGCVHLESNWNEGLGNVRLDKSVDFRFGSCQSVLGDVHGVGLDNFWQFFLRGSCATS